MYDLNSAMQSRLQLAGYSVGDASKIWADVCSARAAIRLEMYEHNKFRTASFPYHEVRLSGNIKDVRVTEDYGVEYLVSVNGVNLWVQARTCTVK